MSVQTYMMFFLLWNAKEDILKNDIKGIKYVLLCSAGLKNSECFCVIKPLINGYCAKDTLLSIVRSHASSQRSV